MQLLRRLVFHTVNLNKWTETPAEDDCIASLAPITGTRFLTLQHWQYRAIFCCSCPEKWQSSFCVTQPSWHATGQQSLLLSWALLAFTKATKGSPLATYLATVQHNPSLVGFHTVVWVLFPAGWQWSQNFSGRPKTVWTYIFCKLATF